MNTEYLRSLPNGARVLVKGMPSWVGLDANGVWMKESCNTLIHGETGTALNIGDVDTAFPEATFVRV